MRPLRTVCPRRAWARSPPGEPPRAGGAPDPTGGPGGGLFLAVAVAPPGGLRLRALRAALWGAVLCTCLGLITVRRAVAREARATAQQKRFLAGVTHELRTPLTAIRLFGETLAEGR